MHLYRASAAPGSRGTCGYQRQTDGQRCGLPRPNRTHYLLGDAPAPDPAARNLRRENEELPERLTSQLRSRGAAS